MHINIVSLFPSFFDSPLDTALLQRAREAKLVSFDFVNPRDVTTDKHKTVDDRPYGGTPGMLLMLEPLVQSLRDLADRPSGLGEKQGLGRTIILSPTGKPLTQALARELSKEPTLTLICGRYEGIDARLEELFPLESIAVGDAVINGGESAALLLIEAATRLLPGFMGKEASGDDESFSHGLLEHPHYTRPEVFEGHTVPPVLLSGNHQAIATWRREQALERTLTARPDLLDHAPLDGSDMRYLLDATQCGEALSLESVGRNLHTALVHYPILLGNNTCGATSVTNLDIHDMARCACTYGLASCGMITPLEDQSRLVQSLVDHWTKGQGAKSNPDRARALSLVRHSHDLKASIEYVTKYAGEAPFIVATSAKQHHSGKAPLTPLALREILCHKTVLMLFGTGQGLAEEVLSLCDAYMRPLRWLSVYNHLSVRSAYAITIDRILGDLA